MMIDDFFHFSVVISYRIVQKVKMKLIVDNVILKHQLAAGRMTALDIMFGQDVMHHQLHLCRLI